MTVKSHQLESATWRSLSVGAVAVLVFLARAARAERVPLYLAPARRIGRVCAAGFLRAGGPGRAPSIAAGIGGLKGELVLAGGRIEVMHFHGRKFGRLERRRFLLPRKLDMHELAGHALAEPGEH